MRKLGYRTSNDTPKVMQLVDSKVHAVATLLFCL